MREKMLAMQELWSKDEAEFEGEFLHGNICVLQLGTGSFESHLVNHLLVGGASLFQSPMKCA